MEYAQFNKDVVKFNTVLMLCLAIFLFQELRTHTVFSGHQWFLMVGVR